MWPVTPVRLLATAGLRLVTDLQREAILDQCRALLASSRFLFRHDWAKVIGGDMEGVFAWTGANYATGALQAGWLVVGWLVGCWLVGCAGGSYPSPCLGNPTP